jgi:hypothetical protein
MATEAVWVKLPEVAVNVAVDDPAAVPAGAFKVRVAAVPGVNVTADGCAVTPAGNPLMATCTVLENPFWGDASNDKLPDAPPDVKLRFAGMTLKEKSGGGAAAVTLSDAVVLMVCPLTAVVNMTVAVPMLAEEAAVQVSVTAVPGVNVSVAGLMLTPAGSPDTATVTAPVSATALNSKEVF